jgi:NUMOD4 motif
MKEVWRVIKDFDAYAVSNLGRVKRIKKSAGAVVGRILRTGLDAWGYSQLTLIRNTKRYTRKIHILVANAFIPNPQLLREVNHKGKKSDNRAHRLERLSTKDHALDIVRRQQRGDGVFFSKSRGKYRASIPDPVRPQYKLYLGSFNTKKEAMAARKAAIG